MRICLIGGTGFIGSHLADLARSSSDELIVFSHSPEKFRSELPDIVYIYDELENIELSKHQLFAGVDVVIHMVSTITPVQHNVDVQAKVASTVKLLDICIEMKVPRFIFISTGGAIYGIAKHLPIRESHPTNPISSYGIAKLTIEKYLALYQRLYGLNYLIVRPGNAFGSRQNPWGNQGIIAVYLWNILNNKPVIKFGEGDIIRDYIHVSDLVQGIYLLCKYNGDHCLFNIASGLGTSINQLIALIAQICGKPVNIEQRPHRDYDVPGVVLDTSLMAQELGWQHRVSLEEGIRQTLLWMETIKLNYPHPDKPSR